MITKIEEGLIIGLNPLLSLSKKLNEKVKNILMVLSFLVLMGVYLFTRTISFGDYYGMCLFVAIVSFFLLLLASFDEKLDHLSWNKPLLITWIVLGGIMVVSEIVVPKSYYFTAGIYLLFFTALYFVWNNHSNQAMIWNNFFLSARIAFIGTTLFAFLFRQRMEGYRYSGIFTNPNTYGLTLIVFCAVYITYLDYKMKQGVSLKKCFPLFIECGFGFFLLFMTQSRTSLLTVVIMGFVWFAIRFIQYRMRNEGIKFVKYILVFACMVVVVFPIAYKLLHTLPNLIQHPIEFENDKYYAKENNSLGITAYAADNTDNQQSVVAKDEDTKNDSTLSRFWSSVKGATLDQLLNGRYEIYQKYSERLNVKGHKKISLKVDGEKYGSAHNTALQFGFTYGVCAMVAYIVLNVLVFINAILYFKRRDQMDQYAIFPLIYIIGFTLSSLTEAMMLPLQSYPAFVFLMMTSILIVKKGTEQNV